MQPLYFARQFSTIFGVTIFFLPLIQTFPVYSQTPLLRSCTTGDSPEPLDKMVEKIILKIETIDDEFEAALTNINEDIEEYEYDDDDEDNGLSDREISQLQRANVNFLKKSIKILDPYIADLNQTFKPLLESTKFYSRGEFQQAINIVESLPNLSTQLDSKLKSIPDIENSIIKEGRKNQKLFLDIIFRKAGNRISSAQKRLMRRQAESQSREAEQKTRNSVRRALQLQTLASYAAGFAMVGNIYLSIGQTNKALTYLEKSLDLSRNLPDQLVQGQTFKASIINDIAAANEKLSAYPQAFKIYKTALDISIKTKDPINAAYALRGMGSIQSKSGANKKALNSYFNALQLVKDHSICDDVFASNIISSIGTSYLLLDDPHNAIKHLVFAKELFENKVGVPWYQIDTLTNLGIAYRNTQQFSKATENLETAMNLIIQLRRGLLRSDRETFLQTRKTSEVFIDLLIKQNKFQEAYRWINSYSTSELIDYERLINANVSNVESQKLINNWNSKNKQLQLLRKNLQESFSEPLSLKVRILEKEVNNDAEVIAANFPEIAEIFEIKLTDVQKLRSSIPQDHLIIQPAIFTNINSDFDIVNIFMLSKDGSIKVKQHSIESKKLDAMISLYRRQLQNWRDSDYVLLQEELYNIFIRPISDDIFRISPKQISFILEGKLRYIPFETFFDKQSNKHLIEQYPINYLTRLSVRSLERTSVQNNQALDSGVLAIANPVPYSPQDLPGAEDEAKLITQQVPKSKLFIREDATLNNFKIHASRFPFLHLATHGCFNPKGCSQLNMKPNTLLFSDQQYDISDAAFLGLNNTELIVLSTCQTAQETDADGKEISGLAYLFERAGAKSVIASVWNAPDQETKDLMFQFYKNLREGMTKSDALQQAKIKYISKHPFFWAPLILIGDAR